MKYRRKVITEHVREQLVRSLTETARKVGATVREINGTDDHLHLLLDYPPVLSISKLVNSLKLVSSRMIRKQRIPAIRKILWGDHFWSPNYFAASCGGAPLEKIAAYITNQAPATPA